MDLGKTGDAQINFLRPPIAEPLFFFDGHNGDSKKFAKHADRQDVVAPLYRDTVLEILSTIQDLNYNKLGWGDSEARQLAIVLPLCQNLRELRLRGNAFGPLAGKCFADAIERGAMPRLVRLELYGNR